MDGNFVLSLYMEGKILGIGLQRTGTTSLYHALKILGFQAAPDAIALFYDRNASMLHKYDAFMDNPIPLLYQEIDQRIPDCRFILTTRSMDSWLHSVQWLFETELPKLAPRLRKIGNEIHLYFYGTQEYDKTLFIQKWKRYHEELYRYFQGREKDLLVLNMEKGEGWEVLCPFLDKALPRCPFPYINRS